MAFLHMLPLLLVHISRTSVDVDWNAGVSSPQIWVTQSAQAVCNHQKQNGGLVGHAFHAFMPHLLYLGPYLPTVVVGKVPFEFRVFFSRESVR